MGSRSPQAAAPCVGAALPPAHLLARAQSAHHDARQHWLHIRDGYYQPDRFRQLLAARRRQRAARTALAAAAAVYHASPHAAALRAAGSLLLAS